MWILYYLKKEFCDSVKDLEKERLSWIIQAGPKYHHVYLMREKDREILYTQRRWYEDGADRDLKILALKIGVICSHKPQNANSHQKLEQERNRFSRRALRSMSWPIPWFWPRVTDFGLSSSRTVKILISAISSHNFWGNLLQQP